MRNRERIIAYNHDYYHNFLKKGLRKPKVKLSEEERKEHARRSSVRAIGETVSAFWHSSAYIARNTKNT